MRIFHVTEYGAVGDGKTGNTASIQNAINACHQAGGGRVVVADGDFVTGTLKLFSNIDLHIEANATLSASLDGQDYPDFRCEEWNTKLAPRGTARCLIYAGHCENVSITGMGKIDCRGSEFCELTTKPTGCARYIRNTDILPARMIFIMSCTNVRLEDFTMTQMAGGWGCWINDSQYVTADKVKMDCNPEYPNSDGIHVNCSCDVIISNCVIHSGDDSIIVRANTKTLRKSRPCERIIVKGCVLSTRHNAVRIAWRNDGVIRNCTFSDLIITDSRQGLTIELPCRTNPTDVSNNHSQVSNLVFNNIVLDRVSGTPVKIHVYPENLFDHIRNISFSNVISTSGEFPTIIGREDAVIGDIYFNDCHFNVNQTSDKPYPIFRHVNGLHLNNTIFNTH
jgi:polygalacturonase